MSKTYRPYIGVTENGYEHRDLKTGLMPISVFVASSLIDVVTWMLVSAPTHDEDDA